MTRRLTRRESYGGSRGRRFDGPPQDVLAKGQTVGGVPIPDGMGVVPSSSILNTGFGFAYHPVFPLATTSWSLIAALRVSPYRLP
jgi:hypothetical protein